MDRHDDYECNVYERPTYGWQQRCLGSPLGFYPRYGYMTRGHVAVDGGGRKRESESESELARYERVSVYEHYDIDEGETVSLSAA